MKRRDLLAAAAGLAATGPGAGGRPVAAAPAAGLKHRSYTGRVAYLHGNAQGGHEDFTVTVQPNGLRTLRVLCALEAEAMLRDVSLTVDGDWVPQVGFVQLTINQQLEGAAWYHFAPGLAECEGVNVQQGRFAQSFALEGPANTFGAHPVHCDAWKLARVRQHKGDLAGMNRAAFTTSTAPMGASGPALIPIDPNFATYDYIGPEKVTVPAGTFAGEHFRFTVARNGAVVDVWALGEDCIPLRLTVAGSPQHYELVGLDGDPR